MFQVNKTMQGAYTAYELIDTEAETAALIVPEKGGMLTSFTKQGEEYIWLREPNFSLPERPRCAVPVLFPACGRMTDGGNMFDEKFYEMDIHGIAHSLPWEVVGSDTLDAAMLTIKLTDSDATHGAYPFSFCVTLSYILTGGVLRIEQTYQNTGEGNMPFSFGFHPYFAISDVRELDLQIKAETVVDMETGEESPAPFPLDFPYSESETAVYLKNVMSPLAFTDKKLERTIQVHFDEHSKNAVLWSQCQLGFLCAEPWNGWPGSLGTPNHETLAAGQSMHAEIAFEI